ncbi:MAG: hypothetical protein O3C25_02635, partial [Chloroflexi bacterium]|nr:hypothetical protein [Chloroflexota bacterium]
PTAATAATGAASGVRPASVAPQATAAPARSAAELAREIEAWAASMCAIQTSFTATFAGIADGVDPTTLDLETRKLRYQRIGPVQSGIYTEVALALAQLQPPEGTRDYHQAVLLQVQQLAAGLQRQEELVAIAATSEEIDATNVELERLRLRTRAEVNFANQAMPGPARTALAACGGASSLGQP